MSLKPRETVFTTALLVLSFIVSLTACSKSKPVPAELSARTFASPEAAGDALQAAAKSGDQNALLAIFGSGSRELISSGDSVQDKKTVDAFAAAYAAMHRWRKLADGAQILVVGADNFPFPIPLKKDASGQWVFDTDAGKDEILARRVGRNELAMIEVCRAVADAQAEYFSQVHDGQSTKQYATKFISDPGRQDGLYWKSAEGQPASPLGPLAAFATSEGYSTDSAGHTAFHGYYFHPLKGQAQNAPGGARQYVIDGKATGGFAFLAYPAEYGNSGVMTFMINQDGVLLQKDLGKATTKTATAISEFDPDSSWTTVEQ